MCLLEALSASRGHSALTFGAPSLQHTTPTRAVGDRTLPAASPPLEQEAMGNPPWGGLKRGFLSSSTFSQKGPPPCRQRGHFFALPQNVSRPETWTST
jgi:hypothetical protein